MPEVLFIFLMVNLIALINLIDFDNLFTDGKWSHFYWVTVLIERQVLKPIWYRRSVLLCLKSKKGGKDERLQVAAAQPNSLTQTCVGQDGERKARLVLCQFLSSLPLKSV